MVPLEPEGVEGLHFRTAMRVEAAVATALPARFRFVRRAELEVQLEVAEGYRASVVNSAQGEASRFLAVLEEYKNAPDVTRKRLYLETLEQVLSDVDKIILDPSIAGSDGGQGVVPYLPLNELRRSTGGN